MRRTKFKLWIFASFVVALAMAVPPAFAQSAADTSAAEALFDEGRELMGQKKYAEACDKFKRSQDLDPAVGTLLNLGECFEKSGKMASAWTHYKEAENLAARNNDKRKSDAAARAQRVQPKLSHVSVIVSEAAAQAGVKVVLDGVELKPSMFATAVPIDAGRHRLVASAPGKQAFTRDIELTEGAAIQVEVPELEPGDGAAAAGIETAAAPASKIEPSAPSPADRKRAGSSQRIWALAAGGVGLVGVGVGSVLALGAKNKYDDAKARCTDGSTGCDAEAASLSRDARSQGNVATLAWGIGIAGLATGAVLWFTAPKAEASAGRGPRRRSIAILPRVDGKSGGGFSVAGWMP